MPSEPIRIYLQPDFFADREHTLLTKGDLKALTFRYENGVCALHLKNELGSLVVLP